MSGAEADLLERVERISPVLTAHRADQEQRRRVPDAVYDALKAQGLFSLLVPRAYGGMEADLTTAHAVWEAVARRNSAAAWNLSQSNAGMFLTSRLPSHSLDRIFGSGPQPVFAGVAFPPASAVPVEGGYRLTGRVSYASGADAADWLYFLFMLPSTEPAGAPIDLDMMRVAFLPRDAVSIIDVWDTVGMRGTGSVDVEICDVFVPDDFVAAPRRADPAAAFAAPLYRLGNWFAIHGEAVTALGIAADTIDLLTSLATTKGTNVPNALIRDRESLQSNLGRAKAYVDAARAYLRAMTSDAADEARAAGAIGRDTRVTLQLAACFMTEMSAKAVDLLWESAGGSAIWTKHDFESHFRDVHVITQHTQVSSARYASVGKVLVGLTSDSFVLEN